MYMEELLFFIEESKFSVIYLKNNIYDYFKVKGETYYEFDDIAKTLIFITDYIKSSLQLDNFGGIQIIVYYHSSHQNLRELCEEAFKETKLKLYNLEGLRLFLKSIIQSKKDESKVKLVEPVILKSVYDELMSKFNEVQNENDEYKVKYRHLARVNKALTIRLERYEK